MNPMLNLLMKNVRKSPNIANSPRNQEILRVLESGSQEERENMARNLAESYGCNSVEEAAQQAQNFFKKQRLI